MNIDNQTAALKPMPMPLPQPGSTRTAAPAFSAMLASLDGATDRRKQSVEETARQAAQQLVATTLVQPMLAQMNNDPFKTPMFHGGQAEETFNQQLQTILGDRITAGANFPIVRTVYKQLMQHVKPQPAQQAGINING
ncbi:MAG: hypothetical protein IT444_02850 [Phycisphaeraceae bacterium]|nr:hypothetical protein [Phycisphaeraceae bacterium]